MGSCGLALCCLGTKCGDVPVKSLPPPGNAARQDSGRWRMKQANKCLPHPPVLLFTAALLSAAVRSGSRGGLRGAAGLGSVHKPFLRTLCGSRVLLLGAAVESRVQIPQKRHCVPGHDTSSVLCLL